MPRLMRQAQRDLGVADTARTILIDGNCAEAGWGAPKWLSSDSFFRREFPDVELLLMTTRDAAQKYFAKRGYKIDYLHIDADHSDHLELLSRRAPHGRSEQQLAPPF